MHVGATRHSVVFIIVHLGSCRPLRSMMGLRFFVCRPLAGNHSSLITIANEKVLHIIVSHVRDVSFDRCSREEASDRGLFHFGGGAGRHLSLSLRDGVHQRRLAVVREHLSQSEIRQNILAALQK